MPIGGSLGLSALLLALHLCAVVAIVHAELSLAITLTGSVVLLGSLAWQLLVHAVRWHPLSVTCVEVSAQGWFLQLRNGHRLGPMALFDGRSDGALIQLVLICASRRVRLLVASDAVQPADYAALRGQVATARRCSDE